VLLADPQALRVRYIVDPVTGEPVVACAADAGESEDWRLFVPEESEGSLMLAGHPVALDVNRDGVCDRWVGYHGTPASARFFRLAVEWSRIGAAVFDAEDSKAVNRLAAEEGRVLRAIRADGVLAKGLSGMGGVIVGVDESGVDIRVHRDLRRVVFPNTARSADDALAMLRALLSGGEG
jgi:hypothetical protein